MRRAFVIGVGMTTFIKPVRESNPDYHVKSCRFESNARPIAKCNKQSGICLWWLLCWSATFDDVGQTVIPIYNLNNNCSTGPTTIHLNYRAKSGGLCFMFGDGENVKRLNREDFSDRADPLGSWTMQLYILVMRALKICRNMERLLTFS